MRLGAVCAYPKKLEEVAARHGGFSPPNAWGHVDKRRLVRNQPPIDGVYPVYTHNDCVCNEIVAITNRVLGKTPMPTPLGLAILSKQMRRMALETGHVSPWSQEEFVASFTGRRRARYELALQSLHDSPFSLMRDGHIKAFIKAEKFNPYDKVNPDPRVIQYRDARYNVMIGPFLRPIEAKIYRLKDGLGTRAIAKGLNAIDRGKLLEKKMALFQHPVVLSIDGSRWDKHITREVLRIEHSFYRHCISDPTFDALLEAQCWNRCSTRSGCRYKVSGNRMSGDMNTALGNCLLMVCMVQASMRHLGVTKYGILDDGDDCLILLERSEESLLSGLSGLFLSFGQEVKLENRAEDIHDVVFCQSKVVHVNGEPRFVRDWRKVLSGAASGFHRWNAPSLVRGMFTAVGECELALNRGVPVLESFALALIRIGRGASMPKAFLEDEYNFCQLDSMRKRTSSHHITVMGRDSFYRAFNLTPVEQLEIEARLAEWDVVDDVHTDLPAELDHRWLINVDPSQTETLERVAFLDARAD